MPSKKLYSIPVLLLVILVSALFMVMSGHQYPVMDGDSTCFLPFAISSMHGQGLVNPIYHPAKVVDPANPGILTWHGFLHPMLLAYLAPSASYSGVRLVIAALWVISLALSTIAFFRFTTICGASEPLRSLVTAAAVFAAAGLLPGGGRPEQLVVFFIAAGATAILYLPLRWHWLVLGVIMGLLMATSPVAAILAIPIFGLYACARLRLPAAVLFLLKSAALAAAVFALCFSQYPFTLNAWLTGMKLHSQGAILGQSGQWLAHLKIAPGIAPFILLLGLALIAGLFVISKDRKTVGSLAGIVAFTGLLFAFLYYFWIRTPDRDYNVTAFSPALLLVVIGGGVFAAGRFAKGATRWRVITYGAVFASLLLPATGFVRTALLFPFFLNYGMPYDMARQELHLLDAPPGNVGITSGLFTLVEDYSRINIANVDSAVEPLLYVQQVNRGAVSPPLIAGYTLVRDTFSPVRPKLFGLKIANTCGGYNFAVYQRNSPDN